MIIAHVRDDIIFCCVMNMQRFPVGENPIIWSMNEFEEEKSSPFASEYTIIVSFFMAKAREDGDESHNNINNICY